MKSNIVDRIHRILENTALSNVYTLNIVPIKINDPITRLNVLHLTAHQYGMTTIEQFDIEKLFYNDEIKLTIAECIIKSQSFRVKCVKYRNRKFNGFIYKAHNTWKITHIQKNPLSHQWIDLNVHSKLFDVNVNASNYEQTMFKGKTKIVSESSDLGSSSEI